jgi:hypothetical protein
LNHPTIFSPNKNLYNVKNNRKKHNFTTQVVAKKKSFKKKKKTEISNEEKLLPRLRRVWWSRELPKAEDMKRKAEKERRKNDGFALKMAIFLTLFVSFFFFSYGVWGAKLEKSWLNTHTWRVRFSIQVDGKG